MLSLKDSSKYVYGDAYILMLDTFVSDPSLFDFWFIRLW